MYIYFHVRCMYRCAHTAWLSCCYLHACNLHRDPMRMQIRTQWDGSIVNISEVYREVYREIAYVCVEILISNTWDYHNGSRSDASIRMVNFTLNPN